VSRSRNKLNQSFLYGAVLDHGFMLCEQK